MLPPVKMTAVTAASEEVKSPQKERFASLKSSGENKGTNEEVQMRKFGTWPKYHRALVSEVLRKNSGNRR